MKCIYERIGRKRTDSMENQFMTNSLIVNYKKHGCLPHYIEENFFMKINLEENLLFAKDIVALH